VSNLSSEEKVIDNQSCIASWAETDDIVPLKNVYEKDYFQAVVNQIEAHYQERNEKS